PDGLLPCSSHPPPQPPRYRNAVPPWRGRQRPVTTCCALAFFFESLPRERLSSKGMDRPGHCLKTGHRVAERSWREAAGGLETKRGLGRRFFVQMNNFDLI